MIDLIAQMFGALCIFIGGGYCGTKFRGHIPLRSPNNKIRLDNAETDLALTKLTRERRQEELQTEHDELMAHKKIEEARENYKALTTGKQNEQVLILAKQIVRKVDGSEYNEEENVDVVLAALDKAIEDYKILRRTVKESINTIRYRGAEPAKYIITACDNLAEALQ